MRGRVIRYTDAELAWLSANRTMVIGDYHAAFVAAFDRQDISPANLNSLRKRNGWRTGRTGLFAPGQTPPNKGKKTGPAHPNSRATLFKPGQSPHNRHPLGHERLSYDGYVEIKVQEQNPYTGHQTRYVFKHRRLWEQVNGPLPAGMALKCLDGDKTNTDPANWTAIPLGMLPRLNGKSGRNYDTADPDLKPTIMAIATLEQKAHELRKGKEQE